MKKLKICFYCDTIFSFGGVQRVLAVIAGELSKEHDVTILTHDNPEKTDTSMYDLNQTNIRFDYIAYTNLPFYEYLPCKTYSLLYKKILPQNKLTSHIYGYSSFPLSRRRKLIKKLNNEGFDIVVGVHAFLSLYLASISHQLKAKTIGWMHTSFDGFFNTPNLYLWDQKMQFKYESTKLNQIIVLTKTDSLLFKEKLGVKTSAIYNPLTIIPKGKGSLNYKSLLAIGRFSHLTKGFDLLIESFNLISSKHKEWTLKIVGEGPEEDNLKALIKKYNLDAQISIYPFTNDIQSHYSSASAFILSSRWEGFPLVLAEAMAHHLPIIASDLPVVIELLANANNNYIFENGNIYDMAEKINQFINTSNYEEMSEQSYILSKHLNVCSIINQWNVLLSNLSA
ncbi:glycosyltransferase [Bacteroides graminisolvens]|uniref:glycosyltransferase n=1 Tax=Bacteroides graminisolvens TaxID=477666 RepID=UPI0029C7B3FD|nr:glycosyltransferase [Bacteroides graminisolvens]